MSPCFCEFLHVSASVPYHHVLKRRNEAIPDWPRAPMAVPQVAVSQDNKGKGRVNESSIKQELEDEGRDAQVGRLSGVLMSKPSKHGNTCFRVKSAGQSGAAQISQLVDTHVALVDICLVVDCRSSNRMAWQTNLVAQ